MRCRIALAFGDIDFKCTDALPLPTYREWQRYFNQEPWGSTALDLLHSRAAWQERRIHTKSSVSLDSMLMFRPPRQKTKEEVMAKLRTAGWRKINQ